ncbi:MAG: ABC transporter permease subunit [Clostridia bacterium]|nr:ABC transporter permease subunit [Clostridia bacterium]
MISIIKENKNLEKTIKAILVLIFWLAVWQTASLVVKDDLKLFLPSPIAVIKKWFEVGFKPDYIQAALFTLLRVIAGFITGVLSGFVFGLLTSQLKIINLCLSPVMKIIRAVPVVSFIILAFLFINVDSLPIFISLLMVIPLVWQTVHDSITQTDIHIDEMCKTFKLNRFKTLFLVKLPQCTRQIVTACINALGFAWKSGVAAEVLCTPDVSLGHKIYSAKASLGFDEVYAVTLTVVLLSIIIEMLLKRLVKEGGAK